MTIKSVLSVVVLAALATQASQAQALTVKQIVDAAVGPRLDSSGNRRYVGVAVGVIKNGSRYQFHYGEAVRGTNTPSNYLTYFAIGSVTKTFTATLLALYDHRGVVSLSTKLDDITPYPLGGARTQIKLEDLATHHSGLTRDPPGGDSAYQLGSYSQDMDALMDSLATCTTANPCSSPIPATSSDSYSNYAFAVLAKVLAKYWASGATVLEALHGEIFAEVGMYNTGDKYDLTDAGCDPNSCSWGDYGSCSYATGACHKTFSTRAAVGYEADNTTRTSSIGSDDNVKAGSGTMWSTIDDMLIWLGYNMGLKYNYWNQEYLDILPVLHTPRVDDSMGLAWRTVSVSGGLTAVAKSGSVTGFNSYIAWIPGTGGAASTTGVIVLVNSEGFSAGDLALDLLANL